MIMKRSPYSDKEPTIRIGSWKNKRKISELSDKQLENIARYRREQENKKRKRKFLLTSGISSAALGALASGLKPSGAVIGGALGLGGALSFNEHVSRRNERLAEAAKKELEKRKKNGN